MQNRIDRLDAKSFDWVLLRSFLAIYRSGSVAAAARATGQQQPTLSRHLADLEKQLGRRLFERAGRGLRATEAAALVAEHAEQMESIANRLSSELTAQAQLTRGVVRIAATQLICGQLLMSAIDRLVQRFPELQIELLATDIAPNLLEHEADIVIRLSRPTQKDIIARKLGSTRIVAVAHERYLAQSGTPHKVSDLRKHRLLGLDKSDVMIKGLTAAGCAVEAHDFCFRCDDKASYFSALSDGLGIGFIGDFFLPINPQLKIALPGITFAKLDIWQTVHSDIHNNTLIRQVFDELASALSAQFIN